MKIATVKTVNGLDVKVKLTDSVVQFIKQIAIIESINGGQNTYKINNIVYKFDYEDRNN